MEPSGFLSSRCHFDFFLGPEGGGIGLRPPISLKLNFWTGFLSCDGIAWEGFLENPLESLELLQRFSQNMGPKLPPKVQKVMGDAGGGGVLAGTRRPSAAGDVSHLYRYRLTHTYCSLAVRRRNLIHPLARDDDVVNNDRHGKAKRNWFYYGRKDP